MYVIRTALRASTRRPPARFIRGRRYSTTPRARYFHSTRPLAQAAHPPPAPDSTPLDSNGANTANRENTVAGEIDGPVASDDPESLAQKLQRSRETSRRYSAALRRQQRGKKAQGLPPVHIPNWFLNRSVFRHQDLKHGSTQLRPNTILSVAVTHAETGEQATCALQAGEDVDIAQDLSRLVRGLWGKRLDDEEKRKVEIFLEERAALVEKMDLTEPLDKSNTDIELRSPTEDGKKPASVDDTAIDITLTALDHLVKERLEESSTRNSKYERAARRRELAKSRQLTTTKRLSSLVIAEIRAAIAASLSALRPAEGDSFASVKTNLVLHSPAVEHEKSIDTYIYDIARELGSDVVVLNAQHLAQLAGDYLGEGSELSPRSIRSLGYETYRLSAEYSKSVHETEEPVEEEQDLSQPSPIVGQPSDRTTPITFPMITISNMSVTTAAHADQSSGTVIEDNGRPQSNETQLEDLKLATLLEALIDSTDVKQSRGINASDNNRPRRPLDRTRSSKTPAFFDYSLNPSGTELELNATLPANAKSRVSLAAGVGPALRAPKIPQHSKIIHVKDFKELNATHYGGRIVQKLEEIIRKRRQSGESIMIVGSTCSRDLTPELSAGGVRGLQGENEDSLFRTIVLAPNPKYNEIGLDESRAAAGGEFALDHLSPAEKNKFRNINLFHIQAMLRSLDPTVSTHISDLEYSAERFHPWATIFSESSFSRVMTYDEVHRIAVTALGLHIASPRNETTPTSDQLSWAHVALAMGLLKASDAVKYAFFDKAADASKRLQDNFATRMAQAETRTQEKKRLGERNVQRQRELQRIALTATKYEKRLLSGIADPDQIKTTFEQIHVPRETVESIRTITSLSLLRPEAFSYGILATEKMSGALLYGPPGTGKTLLAKAVAKESGSTVLEVSGSQIMDKFVGEGEKNVTAVFSLAQKLSPCIVFLDEADAIFSSRDTARDRVAHRDILNQFLKEWDGLNDLSVFVMVATNRPFDLDDAVIRRLPRRILVDLPTQDDRKEILNIHLKGEQLDESVNLDDLAKRTPFYSGSDLKNVVISAAMACVKEENEQAAALDAKEAALPASAGSETTTTTSLPEGSSADKPPAPTKPSFSASSPLPPYLIRGLSYKFPEKRTLRVHHFDQALQEISASINEDMSSLNAIKKFDEKYGDRKGNKRRKDFGFGVLAERNDSTARVRI